NAASKRLATRQWTRHNSLRHITASKPSKKRRSAQPRQPGAKANGNACMLQHHDRFHPVQTRPARHSSRTTRTIWNRLTTWRNSMTEVDHLSQAAQAALRLPDHQRIERISGARWIGYTRAQ